MENEIIELLLRLNLVMAAAILFVLAVRLPVRRWFGARVGYALWLIPLAAALMCFAPARVVNVVLDSPATLAGVAVEQATPLWTWGWAFGALVSLAILIIRQARFTQSLGRLGAREDLGARVCTAESVAHGPAVIGVLRPMIVTPADFDSRFDDDERRLVLAHERAHVAQGDPWINAVVLALQCLNWFNPLVHIGARLLRIDQELACDAAVLAQAEGARRRYAEAMLKTHVSAAVPIGCAWPASDAASFKERIAMLKRTLPSRKQTLVGAAAVLLATGAVAAVAWAAQPPRVVATYLERAEVPQMPDLVLPISAEDDLEGGELDIDLDGDGVLVIDGEIVHPRDLTPEQREELRQTLEEAREAMADAREAIRDAARVSAESQGLSEEEVEAIREAVEEARIAQEAVRAARLEALAQARQALRDAARVSDERQGLSEAEMEAIREAVEEARITQEEVRAARLQALAEAREAMREAQTELAAAQLAMREMPDVREALRQAEVEITRAIEEARAAGDDARADALERAAEALEASADRADPDNTPDNE
jgi:beta-lactamase regulating signal transducer with metallopeptidase domain/5-bromo-4-chloroindolyl phosphate hydrolysis protein